MSALAHTSMLWRRVDQPGHDAARLSAGAAGVCLEGSAVFSESGRACALAYRVECDAAWRTRAVRITGWCGADDIALTIAVDAGGRWTVNGVECAAVQGCADVDLSFTPATNMLPIRRLALDIGAAAEVRAAWLRFPELTLEPLDQRYTRVAALQYRYEAPGHAFVALLDTNEAGMVRTYQGLWQAEPRDL